MNVDDDCANLQEFTMVVQNGLLRANRYSTLLPTGPVCVRDCRRSCSLKHLQIPRKARTPYYLGVPAEKVVASAFIQ